MDSRKVFEAMLDLEKDIRIAQRRTINLGGVLPLTERHKTCGPFYAIAIRGSRGTHGISGSCIAVAGGQGAAYKPPRKLPAKEQQCQPQNRPAQPDPQQLHLLADMWEASNMQRTTDADKKRKQEKDNAERTHQLAQERFSYEKERDGKHHKVKTLTGN